jgi:hypothetical protein
VVLSRNLCGGTEEKPLKFSVRIASTPAETHVQFNLLQNSIELFVQTVSGMKYNCVNLVDLFDSSMIPLT